MKKTLNPAQEPLAGLKSNLVESPAENPSVWIMELKSRKSRKSKKSNSAFFLMVEFIGWNCLDYAAATYGIVTITNLRNYPEHHSVTSVRMM